MSTKREEEKNEKIIRGLMKLPPNRRCINCNSLGPQYVCTDFWTFVCITCSGIHREFTHRVKSVSMAKFTKQEVEALQNGGNQRARELFLKNWDMQQMRLPDSSNVSRIREFIKDVYVNKKYTDDRLSNKQHADVESPMYNEDPRRASSYHSFSQSPPYDYQYEDRRYGKQFGTLTRQPGSDRGQQYQGKTSSVNYSPGRLHGQMYEDRFANESSGSRISDFSVSSAGDQFRFDVQSPNSQEASPRANELKDIKKDYCAVPHPRRSASSGSFARFDGNTVSSRPADSMRQRDAISKPVHSKVAQNSHMPTVLPTPSSASSHGSEQDLFKLHTTQNPKDSTPPIDLFAGCSDEPSSTSLFEKKSPALSLSQSSTAISSEGKTSSVTVPQNEGWATFDIPNQSCVDTKVNPGTSAALLPGNLANNISTSWSLPNQSGFGATASQGTSAAVLPGTVADKESAGWLTPQQPGSEFTENKGTPVMLPAIMIHKGSVGSLVTHHTGFGVTASQGTSAVVLPGAEAEKESAGWLAPQQPGFDATSIQGTPAAMLAGIVEHKGSVGGLVDQNSGFDATLTQGTPASVLPGTVALKGSAGGLAPRQPGSDVTENKGTPAVMLPGIMIHKGSAGSLVTHHTGFDATIIQGTSASILPDNMAPRRDVGGVMPNSSGWFAAQNFGPDGTTLLIHDQWHANVHGDNRLAQQNISQLWNAFDETSISATHAPVMRQLQDTVSKVPVQAPTFHEQYSLSHESFQGSVFNADAGSQLSFNALTEGSSFSASFQPLTGGLAPVQNSTNPFDLLDDSDSATTSSLFDMSYLQSALPNSQSHDDYLGGLSEPWFPQHSMPTFHPSPEGDGGMQYLAGQGPTSQLQNLPPQGHTANSFGGNPFA